MLLNNTQFRFSQNIQPEKKKKSLLWAKFHHQGNRLWQSPNLLFKHFFLLSRKQPTNYHTNHPSPNIYTSTLLCLRFCHSLSLSFFPTLIPLVNYLLIIILGTALTSQCSLPSPTAHQWSPNLTNLPTLRIMAPYFICLNTFT